MRTEATFTETERLQADLIAATDELARLALEPLTPVRLGSADRLVSDVNALLASLRSLSRRE